MCLVFENDKGMGGFSPLFMGHPHHGNFLDSRVAQQASFKFHGRNVFSSADDDILEPVPDFHITVRVNHGRVSGVEPPVPDCFPGCLWVVVIPFHHHIPPDDYFSKSLPVLGNCASILKHHFQLTRTHKFHSLAGFDPGTFRNGKSVMLR